MSISNATTLAPPPRPSREPRATPGFAIALCEEQDATLGLATSGTRVQDAKLLVTIGGDGTLLRAAQIAAPHEIPSSGEYGALGLPHRN